jgi:hypothetical protein
MTAESASVLLAFISDSYEANKKMALDLLKSYPPQALSFDVIINFIFNCYLIPNFLQRFDFMKELLGRCFKLSESHRPPDCTVAANTFSLIVSCRGAEKCIQSVFDNSR